MRECADEWGRVRSSIVDLLETSVERITENGLPDGIRRVSAVDAHGLGRAWVASIGHATASF